MNDDRDTPLATPAPDRISRGGLAAVIVVAAMLLSAWFIGPGAGYWAALQKRAVAEPPDVSWSGLWDTRTYAAFEAAAGDALRAKPWATALVNGTILSALGASGVAQASTGVPGTLTGLRGNDAELFFGGEFTEECPFLGDGAARGLERMAAAALAGGKRLLYVVVPNKSTVYMGDGEGWRAGLSACERRSREILTKIAAANPAVILIEPQRVVRTAPELPYWRGDTHWTPRGGLALTQVIMEALGGPRAEAAAMRRMAHVRDLVVQEDLYMQLGLRRITTTPWWGPRPADASSFASVNDGRPWPIQTFRSPHPWPGMPGNTLVLYDSFMYTPELYGQVSTMLPSGTFQIWDRIPDMTGVPDSDLVVLETTERLALGRLAGMQEGGPWQSFIDYLAHRR